VLLASLCSTSKSDETDSPLGRSFRQHPSPQHSVSSGSGRAEEAAMPHHHLRHERHRLSNGENIDSLSRGKYAELAESRGHLQLDPQEDAGNSVEDNTIVKERHSRPTTECKGCAKNRLESQMDHGTFLHLMLEKEKLKILKKLGLTEPPVITGQLANEELPSPLASGDMVIPHTEHAPDMDLEDFYAKTEQVIVFSESRKLYTAYPT